MVLGARKAGAEARALHAEDVEKAARLEELLEAAEQAERELARAHEADTDVSELHRLGVAYGDVLTDAMRAAYARERALVGPRGYEDRIYRRRRLARPEIKAVTELAERLLTMRERHLLHGVERAPLSPAAA